MDVSGAKRWLFLFRWQGKLVAEAALDEGSDGALDLRVVLIEMAARAMARVVLDYDLNPLEVREMVLGRFATLLTEALEHAQSRLPTKLSVMK